MTTSSEDVLSMVNHVRHKKSDGVLYVMAERLAWIMNGRDTFSISHNYSDIKLQKISPDGKSKIQLQVVLHDGGASTFHFSNPEGAVIQIQERDSVKELLQQLLPRFKRKVNKELEEKNTLLAKDPELFQLYRDLVTSQVITADEFWAAHMPQKTQSVQMTPNQVVGVSGAFLADIKPQTDGCNGLKYNLTADIIESIFKTYPAVKKKHMEHVPDKLSESEFWIRFFQSHYFHRDRMNAGTKDLFAECMKSDELDIKKEMALVVRDPLVDITSFKDDVVNEDCNDTVAVTSSSQQNNAINQNMIRRFNHHSMMVLKSCETDSSTTTSDQQQKEVPTCPPPPAPSASTVQAPVPKLTFRVSGAGDAKPKEKTKTKESGKAAGTFNGAANHHKTPRSEDTVDSATVVVADPAAKKAKIISKTVYEDLETQAGSSVGTLNLSRADRYFHGPTPVTSTDYATNDELVQTVNSVHQEILTWRPNLPMVLPPANAVVVLGELSPGGALMKGAHLDNLQQSVPQHVQQELKNLYAALGELLRHFWSCFPVNSEFLEEKVVRMRANLERFQYAKLMPFQDMLLGVHCNTNLVDHLNELIEAAFVKFNNWQMRRHSSMRNKMLQ